jgi:hypothetical protein
MKTNHTGSLSIYLLLLALLTLCGGCALGNRTPSSPPEQLAMASVRVSHPGSAPTAVRNQKGGESGDHSTSGTDDAVAQKEPAQGTISSTTPENGVFQAPPPKQDKPIIKPDVPNQKQLPPQDSSLIPPREVTVSKHNSPPLEGRTAFGDAIRETLRQEMPKKNPAVVDIVFCLDTSSSMGIFTESAKKELFNIAHEVARQKADAKLRIALICYGSPCYDASRGWVKVMTDFTDDLNDIHALLSKIVIIGGDEYVARALSEALQLDHWDKDPHTLRLIFVAGNESVYQDPELDLKKLCKVARDNDIIINAVYGGKKDAGMLDGWDELATLGRGKYYTVDLHGAVSETPH